MRAGGYGGGGVPLVCLVLAIALLLVQILLLARFVRNVRAYCRGVADGGWYLVAYAHAGGAVGAAHLVWLSSADQMALSGARPHRRLHEPLNVRQPCGMQSQ